MAEQVCDTRNVVAHDRTTNVVSVVVARQDPNHFHPIGLHRFDQPSRVVCRVDQHALAREPVTDGVHEVDHLGCHLIADREVAPREQLAEIQAIR